MFNLKINFKKKKFHINSKWFLVGMMIGTFLLVFSGQILANKNGNLLGRKEKKAERLIQEDLVFSQSEEKKELESGERGRNSFSEKILAYGGNLKQSFSKSNNQEEQEPTDTSSPNSKTSDSKISIDENGVNKEKNDGFSINLTSTPEPTSILTPTPTPSPFPSQNPVKVSDSPTPTPTSIPPATPSFIPTATPTSIPISTSKPDLIITQVYLRDSPVKAGHWFYLMVQFKNQGTAKYFNLSNIRASITGANGGQTGCEVGLERLDPGETYTTSLYCIVYDVGLANAEIKIDDNNSIDETDENNNLYHYSFSVYPN